MSADFSTEHFKGYLHRWNPGEQAYVHLVGIDGQQETGPAGDFSLADLAELVDIAGQAWPKGAGVKIRYEIEFRREHSKEWTPAWGMDAGMAGSDEPDEDYARAAYAGFTAGGTEFEWQLVRRTVLASDEVLSPALGDTAEKWQAWLDVQPGDEVTYRPVHDGVPPHRARIERICAGGLVVVDVPPGMPLDHLVTWDRVIAKAGDPE